MIGLGDLSIEDEGRIVRALTYPSLVMIASASENPRKSVSGSCLRFRNGRIAKLRGRAEVGGVDRKSTRLNSSHLGISYAVFCLKKKKETIRSVSIFGVYFAIIFVRWVGLRL